MPPTTAFAQHGLLTREQLIAELNLGEELLNTWEKGGLPRIAQGKKRYYYVPAVIKWLLKNNKKRT